MSDVTFELLRDAPVKVTHIVDHDKKNVAEIVVGDYTHRFSPKSRVSKHLDMMSAKDLELRLSGGQYFFVDDQLVSFRDAMYEGFVHEDVRIEQFMELLGFQRLNQLARHRARVTDENDGDIVLRKLWSKDEITIPGFNAGGEYSSELSFVWDPFVKTINSSFDLVRQICTNGMVGLTSFLNTKVPLINRMTEHLDIASTQIQNKVNSIVTTRMKSMPMERASVGDCLLLAQHTFDRLDFLDKGGNRGSHGSRGDDEWAREKLVRMMNAVSPRPHLAEVYKQGVFANKAVANQLPSHLTNNDVFNFATELRTHSRDVPKSSNNALDRFANGILFDRQDNYNAAAARFDAQKVASFSDVEMAFFGTQA